jgi:hypothetical protein
MTTLYPSKYSLVWTGTLNGVPMIMPNKMVGHSEEHLLDWVQHYVNSGWVVDTLEIEEIN